MATCLVIDPLARSLSLLADALEELRIPFLIGGSIASSARGIARATRDIDLLVHILNSQAERLSAALGSDWYADTDQIRAAIGSGRSCNLIYIPLAYKVDLFPATEEFHAVQLERATPVQLSFLGDAREYPVASAEDILLSKLNWYSDSGHVSDQQWQDIKGIIVMNPSMDLAYLRSWARRFRIDDLLTRALTPTTERLP